MRRVSGVHCPIPEDHIVHTAFSEQIWGPVVPEILKHPVSWIVVALTGVIFAIDLATPIEYSEPMLYVLPVLLTWLLPRWQNTAVVTVSVFLLAWLGHAEELLRMLLASGTFDSAITGNRIMSSALILVVGVALTKEKRSREQARVVDKALQESEERLQLALKSAQMGTWDWNLTSDTVQWSDRQFELFGIDRKDFSGSAKQIFSTIHPEDRLRVETSVTATREYNKPFGEEFRVVHSDQSVHWLAGAGIVLKDENGRALRMIGMNYDVTERKQAEEALRESEERLRLALEIVKMGTWEWNVTENTVTYSDTLGRLFGLPAGTQHNSYEEYMDAVFPEDRERIHRAITTSLETAAVFSEEYRTVWPDGTVHWLSDRGHVYSKQANKPVRMIGVVIDITDRKSAEDALRNSNASLEQRVRERAAELVQANERFEWVTKATQDGIWDWDLVSHTVYYSPRWIEMHGLQGSDVMESTEQWSSRIHHEDRDRVLRSLQDYLAGTKDEFWEEYRIRRRDGSHMWVLDRGVVLRDQQGRAHRMVGSETDITWRKQAEEATRRREREFHELADHVPALFSYVDRDRRYRFVNHQYEVYFGQSANEMVGKSIREVLGPEIYANVRPYVDAAFSGETVSYESRLVLPEGKSSWVSVRYTPDLDQQGNVVGIFVLAVDVTALKASEAALRERKAQLRDMNTKLLKVQEEERRRLARDLHDDFTQRLAALTLELHQLHRSKTSPNDSFSFHLKKIAASAEQLTGDLQRLAHTLHPSILEHAGLEAATREQVEEFAARTGLETAVTTSKIDAVPLEQATCLYRVLQEGLRNVHKHAHASSVLVRLLRTRRGVGLCIHDDGRGIEDLDGATCRSGLGLTSMEERLRLVNGTFTIRSKPGDGTEIHAWVPLVEEATIESRPIECAE